MLCSCLRVCLLGGVRLGWQALQFLDEMVINTSPFMPRACICARVSLRLNSAMGFSSPHLLHFFIHLSTSLFEHTHHFSVLDNLVGISDVRWLLAILLLHPTIPIAYGHTKRQISFNKFSHPLQLVYIYIYLFISYIYIGIVGWVSLEAPPVLGYAIPTRVSTIEK